MKKIVGIKIESYERSEFKLYKSQTSCRKGERVLHTPYHILLVNTVLTVVKVWGDFNSWDSFVDAFLTINVLSSWTVWGVFLILHFVSYKFGAKWEERKIEEYMKKELSNDSH